VDFLDEGSNMFDLLGKVGMVDVVALVPGRAVEGAPGDVLGNPSLL
jgi:hypothetical protein